MTGGRAPKAKGTGFEVQCVKDFQTAGWKAKRAWGSNGKALGLTEDVDILADDLRIQCKRKKALAVFLKPTETVDAVLLREDRGKTLIIIELARFLKLVGAPCQK